MENIYGTLSNSFLSLEEKLKSVLLSADDKKVSDFLNSADELRKIHFKNKISLCSIINAKSGLCSEDCAFCAQSARFKIDIPIYPLISAEEILKKAKEASENGASCFSIVTSGKGINSEKEISTIARSLELLAKKFPSLKRSASFGIIDKKNLEILKRSGLQKYHHNLETSRRFFPNISKTHFFEERFNTILAAKSLKLEVCSGGIFGLGETWDDRIELAVTLKRLKVDSVPINFLNPIKGTGMGERLPLNAKEALLIVALFRIILIDKDIKICGGRGILKDDDKKIFSSGASGMMIGNYLTTKGNDAKRDLAMLKALNLEPLD